MGNMDRSSRIKRLRFRAWHRGTREADLVIGSFFDSEHSSWGEKEIGWFEDLLEEQDVDILAWALGTAAPPERFAGALMSRLCLLHPVQPPK